MPILDRPVRNRLSHGITVGETFEEWQACADAGLDIERWESGGYDRGFKAKVVAWHRLRGAVDAHVADAHAEYAKHEQKKAAAKARARGTKR